MMIHKMLSPRHNTPFTQVHVPHVTRIRTVVCIDRLFGLALGLGSGLGLGLGLGLG